MEILPKKKVPRAYSQNIFFIIKKKLKDSANIGVCDKYYWSYMSWSEIQIPGRTAAVMT